MARKVGGRDFPNSRPRGTCCDGDRNSSSAGRGPGPILAKHGYLIGFIANWGKPYHTAPYLALLLFLHRASKMINLESRRDEGDGNL